MRRALALAESVLYTTAPNPRVGCVIVRDGQVLGEGATQPPGGPHAEIGALRDAKARGHDVTGATIYVTLEPCSHFGRTPPCVDAVLAARPARVVVAIGDPNPLVNGQGLARLRAAGIQVTTGVCVQEALALNAGFISRMSHGLPWVWMKMAASLDGRSALHNGMSQWITGPQARADGHRWRARSCVVLTGMGTVLKDNPLLNVRDVDTPRQPRKAVVDGQFAIPEDARLFDGGPVILFTAREDAAKASRLADKNARVIHMPGAVPGRVDLGGMMRWFAQAEFNEVHVEAGAGLSGALVGAGCVDELLLYLAPVLLGDAAGMVRLPMLEHLDAAHRYEFIDSVMVGADLRLRARVQATWRELMQRVALPTSV
ncbi:bifunctional diaminohydroxyphosphoribosylaminopyrimidine deaminase/5-amino-6-(5-phosphoribosylamino)uracil reductase RibD [Achromobacter sp. ES-001]|uniref:bifunctional diaminohydroxyphosphoribosylaminopyrimidine deaminase/5-amino-6-(5-phosphoribosylamino)uracil reductase RibD n=1 Tax=Achromobacter sp. ES-001 TaxID=2860286 RepID=UPI001C63F97B|nr:bifunctional diaminohydroxyphosphoribosylaminopyrimidine deaminase/5-amino-6-(5-phosphoribosylamino)uracil reductase RibD [Achromobacter sp. ES-001]QYJ24400.1 bifunctional diaminohydroxyphosphoribosylaminopyrimidine deaminase/5-amino-6-(5-phosphoribosylamino)uracil reductase RibD [Achromobacter sp. ES-001]